MILLPIVLLCQSFEVASVKVHQGGGRGAISTSGPRLRASAQGLGALVTYAYDLKDYQLAWNTPDSPLDRMTFDIEAIAEAGDVRRMMQSLLADRFKLQVHHESRERQVYALTVGKKGPKFKESATDAAASEQFFFANRLLTMTLVHSTMENLARLLPGYTGLPVIDKTGLVGTYDLKLEATRMNRIPDPADVSVFGVIQDQLGLKLDAQKAMIDMLVVDHAEKPTGN